MSSRKTVAIVQARMGSTRLPEKMMMDVVGKPLIVRTLGRVRAIECIDDVVLASSTSPSDRVLLQAAESCGVTSFAGSEQDTLDRYFQAARLSQAEVVVRITGDCPLFDPGLAHKVVGLFESNASDYASNIRPPTYPDGLDTEVLSCAALETAWREAALPSDREHVTQFIWRQPERFRIQNLAAETDRSSLRWTVDEERDVEFVRQVYRGLDRRGWQGHSFQEILVVIEEDGLHDAATHYDRNEGQIRSMQKDGLDYHESMSRLTAILSEQKQ